MLRRPCLICGTVDVPKYVGTKKGKRWVSTRCVVCYKEMERERARAAYPQRRAYSIEWNKRNKHRLNGYQTKHRDKNRDKHNQYRRDLYQKNKLRLARKRAQKKPRLDAQEAYVRRQTPRWNFAKNYVKAINRIRNRIGGGY